MKPITPQEAASQFPQIKTIPNELFQIINDLILEKFDGSNSFDITWDEIKGRWDGVFPYNLELNFKPYYIKSGWDVEWIKESNYAESGYDRFEFKSK